MGPERTIDADLCDAIPLPLGENYVLCGNIYNDVKERFSDGSAVRTSYVAEYCGCGVFRTRNTIYRVAFLSAIDWSKGYYKAFAEKFGYVHG